MLLNKYEKFDVMRSILYLIKDGFYNCEDGLYDIIFRDVLLMKVFLRVDDFVRFVLDSGLFSIWRLFSSYRLL